MYVQYPPMGFAARVSQPAIDAQWSARCAWRLRQRWPHADPSSLEEAADELWADPELQVLDPVVAVDRWLKPVNAPSRFALDRPDGRRLSVIVGSETACHASF